jgi:hypothetical protein
MKFGKIGLICVSLFLLSAVSIAALAQGAGQPGGGRQGGGQRGQRGAALVTIPVSVLDSYLKLTADQKAKITAIQNQYKEDSKAFAPAQGGAQPDQQAAADLRQKRQEVNQKADTDIKAVLTDDQTKLVPDMNKDLQAYQAVGIPVGVLGDLKLTSPEKTQIAAIADASQKDRQAKMQELQQSGGDRQAMMAAFTELQKAAHDKIMAVLTTSQKTTLETYLKEHPQPQFGGGRRPGGAGAPPPAH